MDSNSILTFLFAIFNNSIDPNMLLTSTFAFVNPDKVLLSAAPINAFMRGGVTEFSWSI